MRGAAASAVEPGRTSVSTPASGGASHERAERFLRELVEIPSVSGTERRSVRRFVDEAAALGFEASIDAAGNGLATRGPADGARTIALVGHIDTVPGWIPVRVEGRTLHGRGSVDAKGPLAALLFGAARAAPAPGVRIVVAACVGEETSGSPGARFLRERIRPDACIIGEPSGWRGVTLGYKGRLVARARCERPMAHSAGPGGGALDALLDWRQRVLAWAQRENAGRDALFERVQITASGASVADDPFLDRADLTLGFRLPAHTPPACARTACLHLAGPGVSIEFDADEPAHATERSDPVVAALSAAIRSRGERARHVRKTGTADMNVVAPVWRCPIAAYGPGDSALDHTPDERLDLDEFARSIDVLDAALGTLSQTIQRAG